ncbi:MAG: ADP-ribosylglycohydrolase family protein [Bacteroidia bacterium]|nr:ADP-ribosylglycohydrolase family protein [Bacteroidia bacterium]
MESNPATDALLGVAIGDAVGVPFEFRSREQMRAHPAKDIVGYGTHHQPAGTWSDDASLTFCLAESLVQGYDLKDIAHRFIRWKQEAYWSARGSVFDIGMTTAQAISRLERILEADDPEALRALRQGAEEYDNGNGSLMRILPLLFYIKGKPIQTQFEIIWEVSALTHRHIRAAMSCLIYLKLAEKLLAGQTKDSAYAEMRNDVLAFWEEMEVDPGERIHFRQVIQQDIREVPVERLKTGGYVIEVLESAIWFFLNKHSYEETILSIINLGHDTDTAAAIAGGLAGLWYGQSGMPGYWVASIARMEDIMELGDRLYATYGG